MGTCSALRGNLVSALSSDRHSVRRHIFCSEAISEHGPHGVEVDIVDSSLSVCQGVAPNADKRSSRDTEGGESLGRSLNEASSFPLEMRVAIFGLDAPRPSPDPHLAAAAQRVAVKRVRKIRRKPEWATPEYGAATPQ